MEASPDGQVSLTDYEVTNTGSDRHQLTRMVQQAREAISATELTALADRGYYGGEEIKACTDAGITPLVPKVITSRHHATGRFDKSDFVYDARRDAFRCSAGEYAVRRFTTVEKSMTLVKYSASACPRGALRDRCTTGEYRRIARWEHEAVLDDMQRRLDRKPKAMQLRRSTVAHPFGIIRSWMGTTHFLCRRLPRVSAEMNLHVLAYDLKRVMQIMGNGTLIRRLQEA
jgi:transposase